MFLLFFFNDTATTEIYTLSLHDALPIYPARQDRRVPQALARRNARVREDLPAGCRLRHARGLPRGGSHQQALQRARRLLRPRTGGRDAARLRRQGARHHGALAREWSGGEEAAARDLA